MSSPGGGYRGSRGYYSGPRFGGSSSSGYNHMPYNRGEQAASRPFSGTQWRAPSPRFGAQFQFRHPVRHHHKPGLPQLRFPGRFPGPAMRYSRPSQSPQEPLLGSEEERKRNISTTADKLKRTLSNITDEEKDHFWDDGLRELSLTSQEETLNKQESNEFKNTSQERVEDQRIKEGSNVIYQKDVRSGPEFFASTNLDANFALKKTKKSKKKPIDEHDANMKKAVHPAFRAPTDTEQVSVGQDYVNTTCDAVNQNNPIIACSEPLNKGFASIDVSAPPLPKGEPPDSFSYLNSPRNSYQRLDFSPKSNNSGQYQNGNPVTNKHSEQPQMVTPVQYQALEPPPEFNFQELPEYELFPQPKNEINCFSSCTSLQPPAIFDPRIPASERMSVAIPIMSTAYPLPAGFMPINYPVMTCPAPYLAQPMMTPPLPPLPPETDNSKDVQLPPMPEEIEEGLEDMQEAFAFAKQLMDMSEIPPIKKKKKKRKKSTDETLVPISEVKLEPIPLPVPPPDFALNFKENSELAPADVERPKVAFNLVKSKTINRPNEWQAEEEIKKRPFLLTERAEAEKSSNVQLKKTLKAHGESSWIDSVNEYQPRFADPSRTRAPETPLSTVASRSNGSNHVSNHNKVNQKSASEIEENNWKDKVINRFLKMSKNEICNMINNSSLRKFDLPMRHLMREKRTSMALEMRSSEDDKSKENDGISEEFVSQLSAMLDPSAEVDIGNLPTAFIYHLNEFMQLGMDDLPPLETNGEPEKKVNEEEELKQRKMQRKFAKYEATKEVDRQRDKELLMKEKEVREEEARQKLLAERQIEFERSREIERKNNNQRLQATQRKEHTKNTGLFGIDEQRFGKNSNNFTGEPSSSHAESSESQVPEKIVACAIDDIFSAGLLKNRSQPKSVSPNVPVMISAKDRVPFGNSPALATYEKTATDLDHIFSAGIAKALSKNSAAVRARKKHDEMDGYRNLSKEEWEARLRPPDSSDKDRIKKSQTVPQSPDHDVRNSDSGDDNSSTSSSRSSSSNNSVTSKDVTKILKSIKERDKDKKRSLNATIRDEVAAEIARKWKEQEKYKKTRGKKKKRDRKGKKKKVRKRHKKRNRSSGEEGMEEEGESSEESDNQPSDKMTIIPAEEIKMEDKSEPEDNVLPQAIAVNNDTVTSSMMHVVPKTEKPSPLKTKAQLKLMPEDTSRIDVYPEKSESSKKFELEVSTNCEVKSTCRTVLTKAQLKTIEPMTANETSIATTSLPKEIAHPVVKSDIKLGTPLKLRVSDVCSLKNGTPQSAPMNLPKVNSTPGYTESGKRKLDVNEYKARLQLRKELQKNQATQQDLKINKVIESPSLLTQDLLDIPIPDSKSMDAKESEVSADSCENQLKKTTVEHKVLETPFVSDENVPKSNNDSTTMEQKEPTSAVCSDHHPLEMQIETVKTKLPESGVGDENLLDEKVASCLTTEKEPEPVIGSDKIQLQMKINTIQTKPTEMEIVAASDEKNLSNVEVVSSVTEQKETKTASGCDEVQTKNDTNSVPTESAVVAVSDENLMKLKIGTAKAEPVVYLSRLPLKNLKKNLDKEGQNSPRNSLLVLPNDMTKSALVNNVSKGVKATGILDTNKKNVRKSYFILPNKLDVEQNQVPKSSESSKSLDELTLNQNKSEDQKFKDLTKMSRKEMGNSSLTSIAPLTQQITTKPVTTTETKKDDLSLALNDRTIKLKDQKSKSLLEELKETKLVGKAPEITKSEKDVSSDKKRAEQIVKSDLKRIEKENVHESKKFNKQNTLESKKFEKNELRQGKVSKEKILEPVKSGRDCTPEAKIEERKEKVTQKSNADRIKISKQNTDEKKQPKNVIEKVSREAEIKIFNKDVDLKIDPAIEPKNETPKGLANSGYRIPKLNRKKPGVNKRKNLKNVEVKSLVQKVVENDKIEILKRITEVEKRNLPTEICDTNDEKKTEQKNDTAGLVNNVQIELDTNSEAENKTETESPRCKDLDKEETTEIVTNMYLVEEKRENVKTAATSDALPDTVPNEAMIYGEMDTPLFNEIARISTNTPVTDCGLLLLPPNDVSYEEEESCKEMTNLGQLDLDNASEIVYNDTINCNSLRLSSPKNDLKDDEEELKASSPRSSGSPFKGFSAETIELPYLQRPLFNLELDEIDNAYAGGLDSNERQMNDLDEDMSVQHECSETIHTDIGATTTPLLEVTMVNKSDMRDLFDPLKEETVPKNLLEDEEPQGNGLEDKGSTAQVKQGYQEKLDEEELLNEKNVESEKLLNQVQSSKMSRKEKNNQTEKTKLESKEKDVELNKKRDDKTTFLAGEKKIQTNNNEVSSITDQVEKDTHSGSKSRHNKSNLEKESASNHREQDKKDFMVTREEKRNQDSVENQAKEADVYPSKSLSNNESSDSEDNENKIDVMKNIIQQGPYVLLEKSKDIEKMVNRHGSQNEENSLHKTKKKHKKKKDKKHYTEGQVRAAIDEGLVEKVDKVNTRESVMARMIQIDLEIHKLVTEKFELYQLLQGGTLGSENDLKDVKDELSTSTKKDKSLTPEDMMPCMEPMLHSTPDVPSSSSKTSKSLSHSHRKSTDDNHAHRSHRSDERRARDTTKSSKSRRDHSRSKESKERREKSKTRERSVTERESSVKPVQKVFVIPRREVDKINLENSSKIAMPDIKEDQGNDKSKKTPIKNLRELLPSLKKKKRDQKTPSKDGHKDDCETTEDEVKKRPSSRLSNSREQVKKKKMIIYSDESSADVIDVSARNDKKKLTGLSLLEETFRQEQKERGSKKRQLKDSDEEDNESEIEFKDRQGFSLRKSQLQQKRKRIKKSPVMEGIVEKHIDDVINSVIENFSEKEISQKKKTKALAKEKNVKSKPIDETMIDESISEKINDKDLNLACDVIVLGETQEDMDNETFVIEKCDKEHLSQSEKLGNQMEEVFLNTDSAGFGDNAVDFVLDPLKLNSEKKSISKIEDHPSPNEEKLELFAQKILNSSESKEIAAEKADDDCDKEVAAYEERAERNAQLIFPRASTATPSSGLKYYTTQKNKIEKLNTPLFLVETRSSRDPSEAPSTTESADDFFVRDDNSDSSNCSRKNKSKESILWKPSMFGQESSVQANKTSRTIPSNDLPRTSRKRTLTLDEMINCKVQLEDSQYTLLAPDVSQEVLKSVGISKVNLPCREIPKKSESSKDKPQHTKNERCNVADNLERSTVAPTSSQPRRSTRIRQYTTHKGPILDIKVFQDSFFAASEDGMVYRYNLSSDQVLNVYRGHASAVTCLCIQKMDLHSDQKKEWLYSGSLDGTLRCYDIKTGVLINGAIEIGSPIQCMDASAWRTLYVGTKCGSIGRFKMKSSALKEEIRFCDKSVLALKATYEGVRKVLIVAVRNQPITIRDATTGLLLRTISGQKQHTVYSLLRNDNLIYCGTSSTSIPVFDFITSQEIIQLNAGVGIVCMCLYKKLLFAGCYDGKIYVFNLQKSELVCSLPGPGNMLLSMEVVGRKIIAGSKDMNLKAWDMPEEIQDIIKNKR